MADSSDTKLVAKYETTVATGLEDIALGEIKEKLGAKAFTLQGRVFFESDCHVDEVLKLKSVNNAFVVIYDEKLEPEAIPDDPTRLESLLMNISRECDWRSGLRVWAQMSKFDCDLDTILVKDEKFKSVQPKFRVSCNRYGPKHKFTSPQICSSFGHAVDTLYGWPIKMKDYDLEILVTFSENHVYVGLTLTNVALDRRNILSTGFTTLRAATCYCMLRVAKIVDGDIVVDPMAGSGAIPVEMCHSWGSEWHCHTLAGEIMDKPLAKCKLNLSIFDNRAPKDTMQLDVTAMPIRNNSVDVFVSDLPFGKRHGSKKQNKTLYPALLREMGRVARQSSGRAVLLTQDFKSMNYAYDHCKDLWFQKMSHFVKIGNLNCYIYLFLRKATQYMKK